MDNHRRHFIKSASLLVLSFPAAVLTAQRSNSRALVGGGCDGCEGIYDGLPKQMHWQTSIAAATEPGEPLEISGVIFKSDGKTPAPDVLLYVYHTDAKGDYSPAPGTTGNARRHGHLRGWMKTNVRGEYKFTTTKPAPYPNGLIPAHIHPVVKEPDKNEYYLDAYHFDGDPLLTAAERARSENRGGSGIIRLSRAAGTWIGRRDLVLGLNIPNYR